MGHSKLFSLGKSDWPTEYKIYNGDHGERNENLDAQSWDDMAYFLLTLQHQATVDEQHWWHWDFYFSRCAHTYTHVHTYTNMWQLCTSDKFGSEDSNCAFCKNDFESLGETH